MANKTTYVSTLMIGEISTAVALPRYQFLRRSLKHRNRALGDNEIQ